MRAPTIKALPFAKIPHQSALFLKYADFSPEVLRFYRRPPTLASLFGAAAEAAKQEYPRREIAALLRRQNEAFGSSEPAGQNIDDLARPDSVAVVTGQQVGLFTGPALTIYKALTAIRLSEELRRRGFNSVPIFWMASDDHDLAEVTRLAVPGLNPDRGSLDARAMLYGSSLPPPEPVGAIKLPESIGNLLDIYSRPFAGCEWGGMVKRQLEFACRPGITFSTAFARLMAQLFHGRGLILFDPRAPDAKKLAAPIIRKALLDAPQLRSQLLQRVRMLKDAGLEAQVSILPRATLVFLEDEGERRLLITHDREFAIKDAARRFTLEELLSLADRAPELFSPNVLLRPVVQDHLFPTVAYVGGPAEVAYFAQLEPIYRHYGREAPVVWPRASFTVLWGEIVDILRRHDLEPEDCFLGEKHIAHKILANRPAHYGIILNKIEERTEQSIKALRPALMTADPSLGPASDTAWRKIACRAESLRTKFMNFEMRSNPDLRREVRSLRNCCYPNNSLQERELGFHFPLAHLGPVLLDSLLASIDLQSFQHLLLYHQ